jgi:phage shock protein C
MQRKLYRSQKNRVLLGVCGGLGDYFNIDPVIVRVITVLLLVFGVFPAVIAYFILALVVPLEGSAASTPRDSFRENISDLRDTTNSLGEEVRSGLDNRENPPQSPGTPGPGTAAPRPNYDPNRVLYILGLIIIGIGVFFIVVNVLDWWRYAWPVLLIIAGTIVVVLVTRRKR